MRLARRLLFIGLALITLVQGGCMLLAATAAGGGAVAYGVSRGTVARTYDAPLEGTVAATKSALEDLGLPVERPRIGTTYAEIDSTLASGAPVLLSLKAEARELFTDPAKTRVEIHIKVFGDKQLSDRILDQIDHRLRNPAPPPTQTTTLPPPAADQTDEPAVAAPTKREP